MLSLRPLAATAALLLCLAPAMAQVAPVAPEVGPVVPGTAPEVVHALYSGTALGLPVMRLQAVLALNDGSYRADLSFRTSGVLSVFVRSLIHSSVHGAWAGSLPRPDRFWSWGTLRGDARQTLIEYVRGEPEVRRLLPPNENEREDVPEPARQGTVDTLSAIAALMHQVEDAGRCEGHVRVFDGRRLSEITAQTAGMVHLAHGDAGPWEGDALLCNFTGQQLAGFMRDDSAWSRRPHVGAAWLARVVPGGPPMPVRLSFETRWVGNITLVLDEAGPGPLPPSAPP